MSTIEYLKAQTSKSGCGSSYLFILGACDVQRKLCTFEKVEKADLKVMKRKSDGNATVYCEGAFNTTSGKTAHGLVRLSKRYRVLSVIDSRYAGRDAGLILDQKNVGIPVFSSLEEAVTSACTLGEDLQFLVIGLAPDGGKLSPQARSDVCKAIELGMNVASGLHDFLSEDPSISTLAATCGVELRDIRKPKAIQDLHFFSSKIEEVTSVKVAVLGTDSAVGKRTTAWILVKALEEAGYAAELVGTGQTAWMQGAQYSIIIDSLVNDFVSGEIEHAVWSCWRDRNPDVIVIEGQGSLMNPAYPGGLEILAAGRPDCVVLQHAPAREEYDGFPGYPMHPLVHQKRALEMISGKPVIAATINHEDMSPEEVPAVCSSLEQEVGVPVLDVLREGGHQLVRALEPRLKG